ncbi:MAG: acyl-CoA reductase [Thermoguttaceae bacterium]|jgi:hypothetical protein
MSEELHFFESPTRHWAVALPFRLEALLADWGQLRQAMVRRMAGEFSRHEWAYLISFLDPHNLRRPFLESFGTPVAAAAADVLARPRGPVAVWLPSNVSLLGPLTLVLLSLTGNRLRLKASSRGDDLTEAFLNFARGNLPHGPLQECLCRQVQLEQFDRHDPRNAEMAQEAGCRIIFGSDEAAESVVRLDHPADSTAVVFSDRRSEAWLEPAAVDDGAVETLVKVFAIYGQAGCTSPSRVVLLGGTPDDVRHLRERVLQAWPRIVRRDPPIHVASQNVLARQWAAVLGWDAVLTARNGAVLAAGTIDLPRPASLMFLPIVAADRDQAARSVPANIQTIGHALGDAGDAAWLGLLARTPVKRFVPLGRMHHFGPTWDGWEFWRGMFEIMTVEAN